MATVLPATALAAVIGCSVAPPSAEPVHVVAEEYGRMYQSAIQVLREEGYGIDRQDYRFGVVSTKPLASPTILEPWKRGNTTSGQAMESTINTQRRVVTVSLEPAEARVEPHGDELSSLRELAQRQARAMQGEYLMRVEAVIEQLQIPTRHLSGSTQGRRMFGHYRGVPAEWDERGISALYWVAVGRDPHLEDRLLKQIVRRSTQSPVETPGYAEGEEER